MSTIEMPRTCNEQLNELEIGESILIDTSKKNARTIWSNAIIRVHKNGKKQFTIRTDRASKEIRVWRLKDVSDVI